MRLAVRTLTVILLLVFPFAPVFGRLPIMSRGHAEICFHKGSAELTPSAKVVLVRLLHSAASSDFYRYAYRMHVKAFGDIFRDGKENESLKLGEERAARIRDFVAQLSDGKAEVQVVAYSASKAFHPYELFQVYLLEMGLDSDCWAKSPHETPALVQFSDRGCLAGSDEASCYTYVRCNEEGCTRK